MSTPVPIPSSFQPTDPPSLPYGHPMRDTCIAALAVIVCDCSYSPTEQQNCSRCSLFTHSVIPSFFLKKWIILIHFTASKIKSSFQYCSERMLETLGPCHY